MDTEKKRIFSNPDQEISPLAIAAANLGSDLDLWATRYGKTDPLLQEESITWYGTDEHQAASDEFRPVLDAEAEYRRQNSGIRGLWNKMKKKFRKN